MTDNSLMTAADTVRDKDRSGVKTQIVGLDLNIGGAESLMAGQMPTTSLPLTAAAPVPVASSASVVTLQAANTARRQLIIYNDSTSVLYVKYGSAATSASYTVKMAAGDYWEMPLPAYTGIVTGIWASANGNALVTEGT